MSTRSTISVLDKNEAFHIYRHHDGYPQGEHGVIRDLKQATNFAWSLPRFEAVDFAAAVVRAMKSGEGSVYLTDEADAHADRDYHYDIRFADKAIQVAVWDFSARAKNAARVFDGPLDEAVQRFESGPVASEKDAVLAQVWEALAGAEHALADIATARPSDVGAEGDRESRQRKNCKGTLPDIRKQVFAAMDAHRAELRAAHPVKPED